MVIALLFPSFAWAEDHYRLSDTDHQNLSAFLLPESSSLGSRLVNKTGQSKGAAIGLSLIPGVGQFYNGDVAWGLVYLLAAVGVMVADAALVFSGSGPSPVGDGVFPEKNPPPLWIGVPILSAISMIHAGVQTEEEYGVELKE